MFNHFKNKKALLALALGLTLAQPTLASTINFDGLTAGSNASSDSVASGLGISFHNAANVQNVDVDGIEIAGTHWQIDTTLPITPVTVANGAILGGAYANSIGLDARDQSVMMHLGGIFNVASFSLNASSFDGLSFGGLYGATLEFLDINGNDIASVAYSVSGGIFSAAISSPLVGVTDVVLAGGAVYDNVSFNVSAVPVPSAIWLFGSALAGFIGLRRRKA